MKNEQFVYVTYIRTTPEKLWQALTSPQFTQRYWLQTRQIFDWKPGAAWRAVNPEGKAIISGEIVEFDRPQKLVFTWCNETKPEITAEGYSRVTYSLEPQGASVKLTIQHEMNKAGSQLLQSVSHGWPLVLASLKSLIETGEPLEATARRAHCGGVTGNHFRHNIRKPSRLVHPWQRANVINNSRGGSAIQPAVF